MLAVPKGLNRGNWGCLPAISLFNNKNMLDNINRKMMSCKIKWIMYTTYYISTHKEIKYFFNITHACYLYCSGCPWSTISTHGATRPWVPLWSLLMSIHGVAFTVRDGTMYFILDFVEVTWTIHIIAITLLHIIHLVTEALLLPSPLLHLSHGHFRYIFLPLIHRPLRWVKQRLKSGLPCLLSADSE
jgi:hypothetical protein